MKILFTILSISLFLLPLSANIPVGQAGPPLGSESSYNTKNGKGVSLKSYRGKVVLIDFWATWCGPCIRAMPHIQELHDKYKDKGLVIIAHTDKSSRNVKDFISKNKYTFIFSVGKNIGDAYGVRGIPHAYLLDTEGKVLWHGHSAGIPSDKLEKALSKVKAGSGSKSASLQYPDFKDSTASKRIKRYQGEAAKGRIGYCLKTLEKMLAETTDIDDKKELEKSVKVLKDWIADHRKSMDDQIKEGKSYEAFKLGEKLSKVLTGHDCQKEVKKLTTGLRKNKDYKAGKEFYKLESRLAKKSDALKKKSYQSFAKKYEGTYYAKEAAKLAN